MRVLVVVVALVIADIPFTALFLWLGARWMKAACPTFLRALAIAVVMNVVAAATVPVYLLLTDQHEGRAERLGLIALLSLASFAVNVVLFIFLIKRTMGTTTGRAALVWFLSLNAQVVAVVLVLLVVRPYFEHAYIASTNSMAPTILGRHTVAPCPNCGGTVYLMAPDKGRPVTPRQLGICGTCLEQGWFQAPPSRVLPPDRFLVDRLAEPRRWDLVVFQSPKDPSADWVKRIVGLPGEEVVLKDGAVWIDGVRQTPPEPIAKLQYAPIEGQPRPGPLDSPDRPWRLGPDEFCVIGDFTTNSLDSRSCGAVPRSSLRGVVTVVYWPLDRYRVLR